MPIKSYLIYTVPNGGPEVAQFLDQLTACEVSRTPDEDVLVLVTDTQTTEEEETLKKRLEETPSIRFLSLVSAYEDGV